MDETVEPKSSSWRPVRIIALIIAIGVLNSLETSQKAPSYVDTPAEASAASGFVVYGSVVLSIWLLIEIILGISNLLRKKQS